MERKRQSVGKTTKILIKTRVLTGKTREMKEEQYEGKEINSIPFHSIPPEKGEEGAETVGSEKC